MEINFDWLLLLVRWLHIVTAVTWIGTSIFFMWLDRSFEKNENSTRPGLVGDLWMVHGGGFYHVQKLQMGSTEVPQNLHWFKWESYWTWMSGFFLLSLIFFTGSGTFLLDSAVSSITFKQGLMISLGSLFISWFVYDCLWEAKVSKDNPGFAHMLTMAWLAGMSYFLCQTLSGRAAYLHVGAMLGTWMTANVFMRIIPRQLKMVENAKNKEPINPDWAVNAKNRSTHNTYFTLPVIFIMLSNHFPMTYGHDLNWLILLVLCAAGAAIREFFVVRLKNPSRSKTFLVLGLALLFGAVALTKYNPTLSENEFSTPDLISKTTQENVRDSENVAPAESLASNTTDQILTAGFSVKGVVSFEGTAPEMKVLSLPQACAKQFPGEVRDNEVLIKNGKLKNVLVSVVQGHENLPKLKPARQAVEIDQRGCIYTPRVAAAQVGQEVAYINSDPLFHNVRSLSKKNQSFNVAMPQKDQREVKIFTTPELFQTKCSVHPWMTVTVAVFDHPYFAVTQADGSYEIKNLPAGNYKLEFWHETLGKKTQNVIVTNAIGADANQIFKKEK